MINDTARLNFVIGNDAFVVKRNSGNRTDVFQLWTQDEDENYIILHDRGAFFNTEREAIDAAIVNPRRDSKEV